MKFLIWLFTEIWPNTTTFRIQYTDQHVEYDSLYMYRVAQYASLLSIPNRMGFRYDIYISMYPYHCRGGRLDWALSFYSRRTAVPSRLAGLWKVYVHWLQEAHVSDALEHERLCSVCTAWRHPTKSKSTLCFTVCQKKVNETLQQCLFTTKTCKFIKAS